MGVFTYYVQNRAYSKEEVLRLINEDPYVHLSLSQGKIESTGCFLEYLFSSISIIAFATFIGASFTNTINKINSTIINNPQELALAFITNIYKMYTIRYYEADLKSSTYSGEEVTILLNKLSEAAWSWRPEINKNIAVSEFIERKWQNQQNVPLSQDAHFLLGPAAVLSKLPEEEPSKETPSQSNKVNTTYKHQKSYIDDNVELHTTEIFTDSY